MQKTRWRALGVLAALILGAVMTGCRGEPMEKAGIQAPAAAPGWEEQLRKESLNGDTALEKQICAAVSLRVDHVGTDTLEITISAPDISQGLMEWMNGISEADFTEAALNEQMLHLLATTEPKDTVVSLPCTAGGDGVRQIAYTDDYARLVSCGIKDFYDGMMAQGANQLEGGQP